MQGSLAERLRVLRAQRGLTLVEAAKKAGIGRDTLSDLERGRRHPVMPTLARIAEGYDVPVEELLEEPVPLDDAPQETGRPSFIDIAWDAARTQLAREKRGGEIPGAPNIVDQRHENEAARRLREEYGLDGNDAETVVDFARERAVERAYLEHLEQENAQLKEENAQLRATLEREGARR
jgi:transcriptional regulator with XRE-family HTH domain